MSGPAVHAPAALLGQPVRPMLDWATRALTDRGLKIVGTPEETRRREWSLWRTIDASPPRLARVLNGLLDDLRAGFDQV
ncbi:hypothetical protein ACW2Q0_15150 [Nocardia sp. R16R-3T]